MITFVPYIPVHLDGFEVQDGQKEMEKYLALENYANDLVYSGDVYSCIKDGKVLAIGGIAEQVENRALVWSIISKHLHGFDFVSFTRKCKNICDNAKYKRLEIIVKESFVPGHRWAEMLGFKCETPNGMINWFDNSEKAYLYAKGK